MLDTDHRTAAAFRTNAPRPIEFCTIELTPLANGNCFVSMKHSTFDEEAFELIDQEIVSERTASIEAAVALVADSVRTAFKALSSTFPHLS